MKRPQFRIADLCWLMFSVAMLFGGWRLRHNDLLTRIDELEETSDSALLSLSHKWGVSYRAWELEKKRADDLAYSVRCKNDEIANLKWRITGVLEQPR